MEQDLPAKPLGYAEFLGALKERIRGARVRAALAINSELLLLYWHIGREILARQKQVGWGGKVIQQLADDLRREFPDMKGLSRSNLLYMRKLAEAWADEVIVQQLVGQLPNHPTYSRTNQYPPNPTSAKPAQKTKGTLKPKAAKLLPTGGDNTAPMPMMAMRKPAAVPA